MPRILVIAALLVIAFMIDSPAGAQTSASHPATQPIAAPTMAPENIEAAIEMLNLPTAKKDAAMKIVQAHRQTMAEWMQAHGQEVREAKARLRQARSSNDAATIEAAGEAAGKLALQQAAIKAQSEKQLEQVLTKEQIQELHTLLAPRLKTTSGVQILQSSGQLGLTPEQNQAVEKVLAEMNQAVEDAKTPEAKDQALLDCIAKIKKLLTAEQQAKFQTLIGDTPAAESRPAGK